MEGVYIFLIVLASWIGISLGVATARTYMKRPCALPEHEEGVQMFIFRVK
jgi:hypothetical protein